MSESRSELAKVLRDVANALEQDDKISILAMDTAAYERGCEVTITFAAPWKEDYDPLFPLRCAAHTLLCEGPS